MSMQNRTAEKKNNNIYLVNHKFKFNMQEMSCIELSWSHGGVSN